MKDTQQHSDDGFLSLVRSVKPKLSPPPGCYERILTRLLEAQAIQPKTPQSRLRRTPLRLAGAVAAAAAVLALAAVAWWILGGGVKTASADFAKVLDCVRKATTVSYRVTTRMPDGGTMEAQCWMARPGRVRFAYPDGMVMILDHQHEQALVLSPGKKQASLVRISSMIGDDGPLAVLEKCPSSAGRLLDAHGQLSGQRVAVYEARQGLHTLRIAVGEGSQLPVRVQADFEAPDGQVTSMELTDFAWNQPIPDSMFALEVPPGYTLRPAEAPAERSLIELLRISAEINNGTFPTKLDVDTVCELLGANGPSEAGPAQPGITPGLLEVDEEAKERLRACLSGLAFIRDIEANGSWEYAGQGIHLGSPSDPICWWKPAGSGLFRVVYGDLSVKECSQPPVVKPAQTR